MNYTDSYEGARFFKSDLQMQTPADASRWRTYGIEADQQGAEKFIRRCYETGLEVIGITDHNFASKDFIPMLQEAITELAPVYGYTITLFPGFEIYADVGRGVHVLALYDPDTDLDLIDHALTECGIGYPRFVGGEPVKSTKRLPDILEVVQRRDSSGRMQGVVICPHSQSNLGIFDNDRIAHWLQSEEFTNPDLLCIEVPKPPTEMSVGWQRLLASGPNCQREWRRNRSIACVMSSDTKALSSADVTTNFIGWRYTWIKMSHPSIESLRQAFLDHESRIRLVQDRPEDSYIHPWIRGITVKSAKFLADLDIEFSANLNTIIGGRGTGKSTIVEYLRVVLAQESNLFGKEAKENFTHVMGTVGEQTSIQATLEKVGETYVVGSVGGQPLQVEDHSDIPDLGRFFPVAILSQKEIYAISNDRNARLRLLDDTISGRLDAIKQREIPIVQEILQIDLTVSSLSKLSDRLKQVITDVKDVELRLKRLDDLREPLAKWEQVLRAQQEIDQVQKAADDVIENLQGTLDTVIDLTPTSEQDDETSTPSNVVALRQQGDKLFSDLSRSLKQAFDRFREDLSTLLLSPEYQEWTAEFARQSESYEQLRLQLAQSNANPDEYMEYKARLRELVLEAEQLEKQIQDISGLAEKRARLIAALGKLWADGTQVRIEAAQSLQNAVPKTVGGTPFVKISIYPFGDTGAFAERMASQMRDGRRITTEDWDLFINAIISATPSGGNPVMTLVGWMRELAEPRQPEGWPWPFDDRKTTLIKEWFTDTTLREMSLWRTPDRVSVQLFRQDGTEVGDLEGSELSVGQRCTAVLALLLARDEVPIIIDQPEEDLDNEFVFHELVPLLRRVKEERQIIIVTHNANIPVNGDSELVVALEVVRGAGSIRSTPSGRAFGALDNQAVKIAVEDIMEGSEAAFRFRFDKYGF